MTDNFDPQTGEIVNDKRENPIWRRFFDIFRPDGRIMDDTPIELPLGYHQPLTLEQKMARIMGNQRLQQELEAQGFESFDEADNFDTGEDDYHDYEVGNDFDKANLDAARFGVVQHPAHVRSPADVLAASRARNASPATVVADKKVSPPDSPQTAKDGGDTEAS